jgi:hypothetical protein
VVEDYVRYMLSKCEYYDTQATRLFGKPIPHVLLVHANALNAHAFGILADALTRAGHRFIPLEKALADPAYRSADRYAGPAGISWLDRWALTRGVERGFFKNEPRVPEWILQLSGIDGE